MFLFAILAVIAAILVVLMVAVIGVIGAGGIVIFGDVIVCLAIIGGIMRWILNK